MNDSSIEISVLIVFLQSTIDQKDTPPYLLLPLRRTLLYEREFDLQNQIKYFYLHKIRLSIFTHRSEQDCY